MNNHVHDKTKQLIDSKQVNGRKNSPKFDIDFINSITITHKTDIPQLEPIIKIDESIFAIKGGLSMVTGTRGSGKSTILKKMITLAMSDNISADYDTLGFNVEKANGKPVIYINFEMAKASVGRVHNQILEDLQLKETPDNLRIIDAVNMSTADRNQLVKDLYEAIPDIYLLFLDGGADTINSVNDENVAVEAIETLVKLANTHNSTIINIVHENAGNGLTRGHYGQHGERKSTGVISISYKNGVFTITSTKTRESAPFDKIGFAYIKGTSKLQRVESTASESKPIKDDLKELYYQCFKNQNRHKRTELVKLIEKITGKSDRTAQRKVSEMFERGYITTDKNPDYIKGLLTELIADGQLEI